MVAEFQSVIGREVRAQSLQQFDTLPDRIYACVGGGSNAAGIMLPFIDDATVELVGVEAGGRGPAPGDHSIRLSDNLGSPGIAQGFATMFLQDDQGQLMDTHSIAAGLDYVGVSPILAHLGATGRVRMTAANDDEVMQAFQTLLRTEGIIPALESAHAVAGALREIPNLSPDKKVVINISGRGDKDIFNVASAVQDAEFGPFLQRYLARELQA
jgi:tryptophan synthase beta chain